MSPGRWQHFKHLEQLPRVRKEVLECSLGSRLWGNALLGGVGLGCVSTKWANTQVHTDSSACLDLLGSEMRSSACWRGSADPSSQGRSVRAAPACWRGPPAAPPMPAYHPLSLLKGRPGRGGTCFHSSVPSVTGQKRLNIGIKTTPIGPRGNEKTLFCLY